MTQRYETPMLTELGRINPVGLIADQMRVVDVQTLDGWRLVVVRHEPDAGYDVDLTSPAGSSPYSSHYRDTVAEAIDKACTYLRDQLRHPEPARALRLMATTQARQ